MRVNQMRRNGALRNPMIVRAEGFGYLKAPFCAPESPAEGTGRVLPAPRSGGGFQQGVDKYAEPVDNFGDNFCGIPSKRDFAKSECMIVNP